MNQKIIRISLVSILFMATLMVIAPVEAAIIWSDVWRLTTSLRFDGLSSMAQMNDDAIWVVWQSSRIVLVDNKTKRDSDIYCKVHNGTWSNAIQLTTDTNTDIGPSITQLANGTIWVVWASNRTGNHDLFCKTSSDNGLSWSNEKQLTSDPNNDYVPSIMQANDGKIWVVWQRKIAGNDEIFYKTFDGSSSSNETQSVTDPSLDKQPSIIQAQDGRIWIVWCSNRLAGNWEIYCKTSFDNGLSWSADTRLTTDPKLDMDPTIFQASDGTIWIVWTSRHIDLKIASDLYYKASSDNGTTWSATIQLTTDPNEQMWPSATQSRDKRIWIMWTSNRTDDWEIHYKTTARGDVNDDGSIDMLDMGLIARAMWTTPADGGTPGDWWAWNPACDLNNDGRVNVKDGGIAGRNYGKTAG